MTETFNTTQVGAPDPELKTSPVFDDDDREGFSLDAELEEECCYFNDRIFPLGGYVCSGDELLRCMEHGVWIREGSCAKE
jgi:hypothetical protein